MSAPLTLHKARYTGALVQPLHQHDALQLSMVLTGAVEETVGGITYTGAPLHIAVKDAGVAHANRWAPGGAQLVRLEAHGQSLAQLTGMPEAPAWRWRFDPPAIRAFLRVASGNAESIASTDCSDTADLLAALVARPAPRATGAPPQWLATVVDQLAAEWSPQLETVTLARRAGVHPVYLARCVRRWYGVSVGDLLRRERLRHVVAQLAHSRDRIALVAYACGFADEAHCIRTVRQALGVTPAALRTELTA
ncbi:helix-turn-helix transcriptional regulator [Gemmatimonas sp.]